MSKVKNLPPNSIPISNINNASMEKVAQKYDHGNKGYLTRDEAYQLYADKHGDALPSDLAQVMTFLGGEQHKITGRLLSGWEALSIGGAAWNWKGDFHIASFGAGNVRVGRRVGQEWDADNQPHNVDQFQILIDGNLVDRNKWENEIVTATIVAGPRNFEKEPGSTIGEAVEIPLTLATQDGYMSYTRSGGSSWVHEKKYLAAAVDTKDLRDLAGSTGGISFFVRLETNTGKTMFLNKDGHAFKNFEVDVNELKPQGPA